MNPLITYETLRYFTYSNDRLCKMPIRGIVISFFGLGGAAMYDDTCPEGLFYAERGILYLVPYNNPWAWMNRQASAYTDEIIDVLVNQYRLPDDLPIVSTGGSMGGLSALVYMAYAKRTPVACVANCPVCDLPYHYTERPDLPRTLYSAFWNEEGDCSEILKRFSPLHLCDRLPRADYHLFHCDCDQAVNKEKHSDQLVAALTERGYSLTYDIAHGRGHCDLTPELHGKYVEYICTAIDRFTC